MKIALGTAQFGMRYGVSNTTGQVSSKEAAVILRRATGAGVTTLDTAMAYGESEASLGDLGVLEWEVVTKMPALPDPVVDVGEWVNDQVSASLRRLRVPQLGALLLHRPSDLLGSRGFAYCDALRQVKARGLVRALGVSIYAPTELDGLWPVFRPDLIQAPLNVLDRRLLRSAWLERMTQDGIRVHTRSVFLQGVLLMPADKRPAYFQRWSSLLDRWLNWCSEHACSPLRAALNFALTQEGIEKVIVGVDSFSQFEEILAAVNAVELLPPDELISEDCDLLEPWRWQLC